MINAKQMHEDAERNNACMKALSWLLSLPAEANPLDYYHSKKLDWIIWYAEKVIKGRWLEAESFILESADYTLIYLQDIVKGTWKEAEPILAKNPELAYFYARITNTRFVIAEPIIATNPKYSYYYNLNVMMQNEITSATTP